MTTPSPSEQQAKQPNGYCKEHLAFAKALETIEHVQSERNDTVTRIWQAIECRVSMKAFLAIITVAVAIFSGTIKANEVFPVIEKSLKTSGALHIS